MVWPIAVPPINPIDLRVRKIKFGIAGCKAVCDSQVITQEGVGMVIKTNGEHPLSQVATLVRGEDLGWHTSGAWKGRQPVIAYWPVMHQHCRKGLVEVLRACSYQWENDRIVMFMDVYGGSKAIVGACIVIGFLTDKHPTVVLIDIMKKRNVPHLFHEIMNLWYPVHDVPISWYPAYWKHYVLFCRMIDQTPSSVIFRRHHAMAVTPPPGTPRRDELRLREREQRDLMSFDDDITPRPLDESAERERGCTVPEEIDPAPMIVPPGGDRDSVGNQSYSRNPPPLPRTPPVGDVSPRTGAAGVLNHHGWWYSNGRGGWG